jgi:mRNA-degrading endonuclease RelE of RelBE toxin-antitoxin system
MYEIELMPKASEDLMWFRKNEQAEILDGIDANLMYEPTIETPNRKRLRPNQTAEWELRLGKYRVLYDVDEKIRIVSIEAIGLKLGNAFYFQGKELSR